MCHIPFEFGVPMKLVMLMKTYLNETYSRARECSHLSDMFLVKNVLKEGDDTSSLIFNFAFGYAIRTVQAKQEF